MIAASALLDALHDLWGPGIVFLALCAWLVRRALRAARNESILEEQRLRQTLSDQLASQKPQFSVAQAPADPRMPPRLDRADVHGAAPEHLEAVARCASPEMEVLWVRSAGTHAAWCERSGSGHEAICVARVESGRIVERWRYE